MATTSGYLRWRLPLSATHFLVVSFSVLILLMLLTFQQQTTVEAKHHRRFSCSAVSSSSSSSSSSTFFDRCPVHKHKICGSDGKLYPSRCHLRRAACEGNTIIRPAHPDQCLKDEEREAEQELERAEKDSAAAAGDDQQKTNTVYGQDELQTAAVDKQQQQQPDVVFSSKPAKIALSSSSIPVDVEEDEDRGGNDIEGLKAKQTSATSTAHPLDYSEEDECRPKDYDLMKEKVLNKINDVSLLFTRLDENNDGQITLNELWKHSMLYKAPDSSCLLTDLVQHEDANDDEKLDYSEFQAAFNKLFSVVMVSLDESLAVNRIEAHLGDNVEIRCDITGEPQRPAIKWYRHGVDLAALSLPYIKVFTDGSLYLTDLALSFAGNYSCQAMNNPTVKQTHVVHVIVPPIVEVTPRFQWTPIGGVASFECRYETFDEDTEVVWLKNDEQLLVDGGGGGSGKVTILNNGTRLQVAALEQTDTGAYTCRVGPRGEGGGSSRGSRGNFGQSVASLLVQDETVEAASSETRPQRLWIFHANGLSIYEGICGQPVHEIDARDIVYQNSVTLCGGGGNGNGNERAAGGSCEWSEDVVVLHDRLFIAQPALNRIIVFQASQLSVLQVIATDARPRRLWASEKDAGDQIWVLCDGNSASTVTGSDNGNYLYEESSWASSQQSDSVGGAGGWSPVNSADSSSAADSSSSRYDFLSEKYLKNRKTIQVVRLYDQQSSEKSSDAGGGGRRSRRQADVIHLQPVDGHFDLVYDLFMPDHYESIFRSGAGQVDETSSSSSSSSFGDQSHHQQRQQQQQNQLRAVMQASPFAYATHWEERSLVKISLQRLEYLQSIRLADCQPISAAIITRRGGGLVAVQCQTPVTHQLNGQLILDQVTDAILTHNQHLNAHQSYLSPDHRYLVNILHERLMNTGGSNVSFSSSTASPSSNTSTIIVQRISDNGVEFLYDVRTSLDIVSCSFVWKNGAYDLVLASGTRNREDLLYLSLADGHVELISGIGRPTEGYHRGLALSTKNRVLSVTATESVFTVDLNTNRILCESSKHFAKPHTLAWTN